MQIIEFSSEKKKAYQPAEICQEQETKTKKFFFSLSEKGKLLKRFKKKVRYFN